MENKLYLIHEDDYITHIEEKVALYSMLKQIACKVAKLPSNRGNKNLSVLTKKAAAIADKMFCSWSIPVSYLYTGDSDELFFQMENELIAPEDAGYYACDDTCCCQCGCCCDNCDLYDDDEDYDDEDYDDYDEDEDETDVDDNFAELMAGLSSIAQSIFGDNVSVHIVVE